MESVAEDEAMRCLILIRNFMEGYQQARSHPAFVSANHVKNGKCLPQSLRSSSYGA